MFRGRHFDRSVILVCVRWYLAYGLSLRDLKEMMAERGISVDHSTIHRWVVHFSPLLLERFNRRKRAATGKWHVDETYIKVRGQWMYLYRAIDSVGDTVEFYFSEHRDLPAAKRFFRKALERHGRPDRVVIDGSQTNQEAIVSCDTTHRLQDRCRRRPKPIRIRQSQYLNNRIEQDHRRIKRRVRPMLGFKSPAAASIILDGIEMLHMMRKRQARFAFNPKSVIGRAVRYPRRRISTARHLFLLQFNKNLQQNLDMRRQIPPRRAAMGAQRTGSSSFPGQAPSMVLVGGAPCAL
ncbi:hypothetical protein MesoLjLa_66000 (plasmid) [Mesorhizobium sp. L-2-11]|nr:hypothetical protein MesoLjLa_66000 [Mesorhizobium sp. L-2-11]